MKKIISIFFILMISTLYISSFIFLNPLKEVTSTIQNNNYAGLKIVLDAGHGGKDNGASANNTIEDEINLQVSMKLKRILELSKIKVVLTRDDDFDLSSKDAINHKVEDLNKRIEIIDEEDVTMFLSIHMNKYSAEYVNGAQVFYRANDDESKKIAQYIQDSLKDKLKTNKKIKVGNYYLLNNSKKMGALIECGFLSNVRESELLKSDAYQEKLAYAIYVGIVKYLKDNYKTI